MVVFGGLTMFAIGLLDGMLPQEVSSYGKLIDKYLIYIYIYIMNKAQKNARRRSFIAR